MMLFLLYALALYERSMCYILRGRVFAVRIKETKVERYRLIYTTLLYTRQRGCSTCYFICAQRAFVVVGIYLRR